MSALLRNICNIFGLFCYKPYNMMQDDTVRRYADINRRVNNLWKPSDIFDIH